MKHYFSNLGIVVLLVLLSHKSFSLSVDDLMALFETEITKTRTFDSLGSLKESILFSTSLNLIADEHYLDRLQASPKEAFYIKAENNSLQIIAGNQTALEHGVFYYLHHLGFRYYFSNPNWHYFPNIKTIFKSLEGVFAPDYLNRRIRFNYGTGSKAADKNFAFWEKANLLGESIPGFTGHSYGQIIKRNKKVFLNHPEYFAIEVEKGQIPKNPKFDISNQDLVRLVVKDALELANNYYEKYGPEFIISMDPSDAGGYCNKPSCSPWSSASDQVFYLANEVAKELKIHYPKALVGLYAYFQHAAPPSFSIEENIVIYIATSFNQSAYKYEDLIQEWKKKVSYVGIRDYYGVVNWDWDLPGKGKGTKPYQIHKSLSNYYNKQDARFYYIETLNGWITKGLGHFIAARTLWDTSINPGEEIQEFYSLIFPESQMIMEPIFEELMGYSREVPLDKDLKQWIGGVLEAYNQVNSISEKKRLEDVMQYLYSLYLYLNKDPNKVESYKNLFDFLYQTNDNSNYATYAIRRMLYDTFKNITPENIINTRTSALNYNSSKKIKYIKKLDSIHSVLTPMIWMPFEFKKEDLTFTEIDIITTRSNREKPIVFRENHMFLVNTNHRSRISIRGGAVNYKNLKGGKIQIFDYEDIEYKAPIYTLKLEPDTITNISFSDMNPGKYWMKVIDNREGFRIINKVNCQVSIFQNHVYPLNTFHRNEFYFEVPETIDQFVIRKVGSATIISPSGRKIDLQEYDRTDMLIEVDKKDVGYWMVESQKGSFFVDGIPPFFAHSKDDLPNFNDKKCFLKFWK